MVYWIRLSPFFRRFPNGGTTAFGAGGAERSKLLPHDLADICLGQGADHAAWLSAPRCFLGDLSREAR